MRRFVRYELKALMRYSSWVRRWRLSLAITFFALPLSLVLEIRYIHRIFPGLASEIRSYRLASILIRAFALSIGSIGMNLGRVSSKAKEFVCSSPIPDRKLFFSLFLAAFLNFFGFFAPVLYLIYLAYPRRHLAAIALIATGLEAFALIATSARIREAVPRILLFGLLALAAYIGYSPIERLFLGEPDPISLASFVAIAILAYPASRYGIRKARSILERSEFVSRRGTYRGNLALVTFARYPSLFAGVAMLPVIIGITFYFAEPNNTREAFLIAESYAISIPIISGMFALYGLSRELGRRDLRLASPNDRIAYKTRSFVARLVVLLSGLSALSAFRRLGLGSLQLAAILIGLSSVPTGLVLYYSAGAAKPVKGKLSDAFRAPLAKQAFANFLIAAAGFLASSIALYFAYELRFVAVSGLLAAGYVLNRLAERRFLKRARE